MYSHVLVQLDHYKVLKYYTKTNFPYNALLKIQCMPIMSKLSASYILIYKIQTWEE
jgi:hypothetical protein